MIDLETLLDNHPNMVALTGAGISAASGIPTYRNDNGDWQRSDPIQHKDFIEKEASRRRYWARSMAGWPYVAESSPNRAHHAMARLEQAGHIGLLATQNVDGLHQRAGHQSVVDLHGRLDRVRCLDCGDQTQRSDLQERLSSLNPAWSLTVSALRPDGDAEVDDAVVESMNVPCCQVCGGTLMPDVVFFGGTVPRERVDATREALANSDGLLVAGSSLQVYSGFRFCRLAAELGKPIAIINRGKTRADDLASVKIEEDAGEVLDHLANRAERA